MAAKKNGFTDLLFSLLILVLSIPFQSVLLGAIIMFFIPGYLLIQAVPRKDPQTNMGLTIFFSIGMSAVVSGIIGLLHNYFIGSKFSVIITIWVTIGILWILVVLQRLLLQRSKNYRVLDFSKVNIGIFGFVKVIALMVLFISFGYYFWLTLNQQPEFTEFYMLGSGGLTTNYPTEVSESTPLKISVGVVNHEGEAVNYTIIGMIAEEPIGVLYPFEVPDGDRREGELTLIFPQSGENQRVDIILGGDGLDYPYRSLTLWVNVLEENQGIN